VKTSTEIRDQIFDTLDSSMRLTGAIVFQESALEYLGDQLQTTLKREGMRRLVDSGITAEQLCYYTDVPHDECQAAIDRYKANPELGKV
jgi:hypothetical protein